MSKQCRPRRDAPECCISSGFTLFATLQPIFECPMKTHISDISVLSDQSLHCLLEEILHPWLFKNVPSEDSDQTV